MNTRQPSDRQLVLSIIAGIILGFAIIALGSCAGAFKQVHFETDVEETTLLLTGPARGHWAEEAEHPLIIYTVLGNDCRSLSMRELGSSVKAHGMFLLGPGVSLCAIPLRDRQRVLVHGVAP